MDQNHHVVVLGASDKPDRFAYKAVRLLKHHEYDVTPVHPKLTETQNLQVASSLSAISKPIDTLTLYVGPTRLLGMIEGILAAKPARVIFNPGTESQELQTALDQAKIAWQEDCTLVLLNNGRF